MKKGPFNHGLLGDEPSISLGGGGAVLMFSERGNDGI